MLFPYCPPRSVMPRSQTNARSWVALCRRRRVPPLEISLPLDQNSRRVRLEGSRKVARRSSLGGRCIAAQGHRSILGRPTLLSLRAAICHRRCLGFFEMASVVTKLSMRDTSHHRPNVSPQHPAAKPIELRLPCKPDLARCWRVLPCFAPSRRRGFEFGPL